jgi:peptidoglycan/xylan/chitin deacetylase (PgdA/CDA1 family)
LTALSPAGRRARLLILTFHEIATEPDALLPDVPDRGLFEQQMTWLSRCCNVLPLVDAVRRLEAGTLPPRAAAVTFDDGYANNLTLGAPILRKLAVPATFFITGGAVDRGIMWNDLIIEALRRSGPRLDLTEDGLGVLDLTSQQQRKEAIVRVIDATKYRPMAQRWQLAERVYATATGAAPPRLMLTRAEVAELARQGFEIGAHTMDHPILAKIDADEALAQIAQSRQWVEDVTGRAPTAFAYPNGRPGRDYGPEHVAMVAKVGFEIAVSTAWGCAVRGSSMLELPRLSPWEKTAGSFWLRLVKTAVKSYGAA